MTVIAILQGVDTSLKEIPTQLASRASDPSNSSYS